jgi:hypothetical protein
MYIQRSTERERELSEENMRGEPQIFFKKNLGRAADCCFIMLELLKDAYVTRLIQML